MEGIIAIARRQDLPRGKDGAAMSAVASARASAWLLLLLPLGAQSQCSVAEKDPHLHFAHGGEADFRGRNGQLYSFRLPTLRST